MTKESQFSFECLNCGQDLTRPGSQLRREPKFTCPKCGTGYDAKDVAAGLKKLDDDLDDFFRKNPINIKI